MTLILREIRRHPHRNRIDRISVFVGQVVDVFDPLHELDFFVLPGAVVVSVFWRAHADERCCAFTKIHFGKWRCKALWPPPLHDVLRVGPGFPYLLDRGVKDAGNDEITLVYGLCWVLLAHFFPSFLRLWRRTSLQNAA